jgi:hypothetical protein
LYTPLGTAGNYNAIADLHTLQFTVTHALGFSVFTSRILATDLSQSHCHFKSHMKSSFHSLIPFHYSATANSEDSTEFNSSAPKLTSWQAGISKLDSVLHNCILLYNNFARTTQKTQLFYCWEEVFTAPLHSNGSYSIVTCVFVAAGMCLPSRCVAINIYSEFSIPAFGSRVTVLYLYCKIWKN